MTTPLLLKRGTAAQNAAFTGTESEPVFTTDTHELFIHDGANAGGIAVSRKLANAFAKLDLSGSAQADVVILHATRALTLLKAILIYTEASSGDTGVAVTIGKESDADYYYTGDSEVSKSAWYEKEVTLLQTAVAAGDTVICGQAGSKTGTGEILVCIEYV